MRETEAKEYKGYNGTLVLTPTGITIKRGFFSGGMLRGEKTIPYRSVMAVQLKRAGFTAGYIQLTIQGSEAQGGLLQSAKDENTITFYRNKNFAEAQKLIIERISRDGHSPSSSLDDLAKLGALKEKGFITQQEFEDKKKKILAT